MDRFLKNKSGNKTVGAPGLRTHNFTVGGALTRPEWPKIEPKAGAGFLGRGRLAKPQKPNVFVIFAA